MNAATKGLAAAIIALLVGGVVALSVKDGGSPQAQPQPTPTDTLSESPTPVDTLTQSPFETPSESPFETPTPTPTETAGNVDPTPTPTPTDGTGSNDDMDGPDDMLPRTGAAVTWPGLALGLAALALAGDLVRTRRRRW